MSNTQDVLDSLETERARSARIAASIKEVDDRRHFGNKLVNPPFRYQAAVRELGLTPHPDCTGYACGVSFCEDGLHHHGAVCPIHEHAPSAR